MDKKGAAKVLNSFWNLHQQLSLESEDVGTISSGYYV
jgi:hypothetical protein